MKCQDLFSLKNNLKNQNVIAVSVIDALRVNGLFAILIAKILLP